MEQQNKEFRKLVIESIETRAINEENNDMIIEGYIAKFNVLSQFMGFYEQIFPDAFTNTLADGHNIFALYNHDTDKILGSTKTGTLQLDVDNIGLHFILILNPNISYSKDMYELVKSGEIEGCSFGFCCNDDSVVRQDDNSMLRTLLDVELIEVTITPYPAYLDTEANTRSFKLFEAEELEDKELKERQKQDELELLKIELDL